MQVLYYSVLATLLVSLISLFGVLTLGISRKKLDSLLFILVSFSTGSMMGGAFFHLLPESLETLEPLSAFKIVILGFLLFYVVERILRWHHCHESHCETHEVLGYQNLLGDGIHNFIDGLIIVSAFYVDITLGISVAITVALHEIPQEISDFGVLVYSGFSKNKAILFNLISAFFAVVGAIIGFLLIEKASSLVQFLLPFAAGGFIYISASDLIPELHKERSLSKSLIAFFFFVLALLMMLWLKG